MLQPEQINMAVTFWNLVNWTSHFLLGTRNKRSCITGHPVHGSDPIKYKYFVLYLISTLQNVLIISVDKVDYRGATAPNLGATLIFPLKH